ncbi:MAG: hypothetical protein L0287_01810 [Anaerolineae bacterium]|nr:hypothetical protein [Anaerolineae bacterium]
MHYHFLSTHFINRSWLARAWYQIVGSNNPDHLEAGTQIDFLRCGHGKRRQLIAYAVKYAVKLEQKQVPAGFLLPGRFWGVVGVRSTVDASIVMSAWAYEDPDIFFHMLQLKHEMQEAKRIGKMAIIDIRIGEMTIPIWIFDPDDHDLFRALMFHVERLQQQLQVMR